MNYKKLSGFSDEISASIDEQFRVLKADGETIRAVNRKVCF